MSGQTSSENADASRQRPANTLNSGWKSRLVLLGSVVALAIALSWLVYSPKPSRARSSIYASGRLLTVERTFPAQGRFAGDPYAGPKVCADCHPAESALYSRSGHALTLRPADRRLVSRRLDGTETADPVTPGVSWSYRMQDGHLHIVRRASKKIEECIAEYAFGSGRHATTFVSVIDSRVPAILEHRLTYFTDEGILALTPGQDNRRPSPTVTPNGDVPPPLVSWKCFDCHSTQIAPDGDTRLDEAMIIPNVSCERCHGPARAHVTAAREGQSNSDSSLRFGPDRWTSAELFQFCAECHRQPEGINRADIRPGDRRLARFQPIGLSMSKCYSRSEGKLNCVTCHDPHARASSDHSAYEKVCIGCHGGRADTQQKKSSDRPGGIACSVSPREGCIDCHMPRIAVDTGRHLRFSDHWIRIRTKDDPH